MSPTHLKIAPALSLPLEEVSFHFSRSSGPGGQHVNRTQSRVELRFDLAGSPSVSREHRQLLLRKLKSHLDSEGVLHLFVQTHRSQARNRQLALERFAALLHKALQPAKARIATAPSAASRRRRLVGKRERSLRKQGRQKPMQEE